MSQLTVQRTINANCGKVWAAIADFGGIHRFHPGVESSPIINGQSSGKGAQRTCKMYNGINVTEEIVEFEEGESMTVDVTKGPIPVKEMRAVFRVFEVDEGVTRVTIEMSYRPRLGPIGYLMNPIMIRPGVRHLLGQVLTGLQKHIETGALIGRGGSLIAAPSMSVTA